MKSEFYALLLAPQKFLLISENPTDLYFRNIPSLIKETTDIKIKNNLVTRYTEYYRVIAVYLKEPDAYTEGKNKLSRIMIQSMVNEYGTAIFIRQTALGKSFEEIKILMDDKIAQKKSRFASHHS
ncbi:MAG: hypothetical protein ACOYLO_03650 [Ferruginibacter sp.]